MSTSQTGDTPMLSSHPIIYSSCQSLPYSPRWHKHWEFMERALWPEWRSFALLDTYYSLGGNFIDTANTHNSEESERLIGERMEKRRIWDQMVVATKFTAGYRAYNQEKVPLQSDVTGNLVKNMHISVRYSLKKLRTDYIDILYVHWWVSQAISTREKEQIMSWRV